NLENKAEISDIPTAVSQLANDSGFISSVDMEGYVTDTLLATTLNDYVKVEIVEEIASSLESKADISDIPTAVSQLTNDSAFITSVALTDYVTNTDLSTTLNAYAKTESVTTVNSRVEEVENSLSGYATTGTVSALTTRVTTAESRLDSMFRQVALSEAEFEALETKDPNTIYYIRE
ncbi:MAG: hypothetical protein LUF04_04280, partial [Bacteroides sp.]|nr:hypothetical protein [Bacteroides sp.]